MAESPAKVIKILDKEKFELKNCYKFSSTLQILSTTEQSKSKLFSNA